MIRRTLSGICRGQTITVTNTYNNARLRSGLVLQQPAGTWTNGFTWDAAHRLSTVSSPAGTFTYTYKE
ncbi:MAG: hypothetical protein DME19_07835 [Verrucomicrobia bacterium]|nr:MAG: hypothetical protein DME19_07835 [Verrucomicrobiota bacterium]